jgi:hypothetical protein
MTSPDGILALDPLVRSKVMDFVLVRLRLIGDRIDERLFPPYS